MTPIHIQWSDDGQHIRKWARDPFAGSTEYAAIATPIADDAVVTVELPAVCDRKEQYAFEEWAKGQRFDMAEHPLHYLFLDERTDAARDGWKAGLTYASRLAALASALSESEAVAFVRRVSEMVGDELDAHASLELRDAARAVMASALGVDHVPDAGNMIAPAVDGMASRLKYDAPQGTGNFEVFDPEPDNHHSALYLVDPNGAAFNVSCWDEVGLDIARAEWMRDTLNAALARPHSAVPPAGDGVEAATRMLRDCASDLTSTASHHGQYAAIDQDKIDGLRDAVRDYDAALARPRAAVETVEFVREWLMSGDHPVSDWEREFAAAIDARPRAAVGEQSDEPNPLHERLGGYVANQLGETGVGANYWRIRAAIVETIERLALQAPPAKVEGAA